MTDTSAAAQPIDVDVETLRKAIRDEYAEVAAHPDQGFHFHTGRRLCAIVGYRDEWLEGVPEAAIAPFSSTLRARRVEPVTVRRRVSSRHR